MEITLRDYQETAIDKLIWAQQLDGNDLCVLPTGAGKSIVIAELAHKLNEPILIIQPNKEILEQNLDKLSNYVDREQIGVYSASMNEKVIKYYTFATIQSIYKKPHLFDHFNVVIIDECHLVNPKNLTGMFTTFLAEIGNPKVIGLTATPYRMDSFYRRYGAGKYSIETVATIKLINRVQPKYRFWHRVIFNINNEELIERGYLCPLKYYDETIVDHSEIPLNKSKSDFNLVTYEDIISTRKDKIKKALSFAQKSSDYVLVFCTSVTQAEQLQQITPGSEVVTAKTKKKDRTRIVQGFKSGKIRVVFNVGVLTTGFDHPELDCIVLLRPTRSIALYYQMLGRGVRPAPGKEHCKVVDLTSTVKNLGKIETIKLEKHDGKWELISETGSWHNKELYRYKVERKPKQSGKQENLWEKV